MPQSLAYFGGLCYGESYFIFRVMVHTFKGPRFALTSSAGNDDDGYSDPFLLLTE